jgi:hypothetical protein
MIRSRFPEFLRRKKMEEEDGGEGAGKIEIRLWRRMVYRTAGPSSRLAGGVST